MDFIIPFLMLTVPGVIAVSVHNKKLPRITRENWQLMLWTYLIYSFAIIFAVNLVMYLSYPQRTVSFSPSAKGTSSSPLYSSFIVKYTLFAVSAAFGLPKLWEHREKIIEKIKKRKTFKIPDDE